MNGWMWRLAEAEAINRQAPSSKGERTEPKTGQDGRPGLTGPGAFWLGLALSHSPMLLGQLLTCSLMHVGP
jgi:hypothetical protein